MSRIRDVLLAYSSQQATAEQVWRALTEHDDWHVPVSWAARHFGTDMRGSAQIFATEIPTTDHALILFSDGDAAGRADGQPIGVFTDRFRGWEVFETLDNQYGSVRVNPFSAQAEGWYISQEAFPLAHLWAKVVRLEESISRAQGKIPYADFAAHEGFLVLINAENLPIPINLPQQGSYAAVFPSPDRFQAFVKKQPVEQHAHLKSATLDGVNLCQQLKRFNVDGLLVYYGDDKAALLPREEFDLVVR